MENGRLFSQMLLKWNQFDNNRSMPWKGEKDPYRIWLSEVILQQTRVEQGLKYYENFIRAFPDVAALAGASDDKVFKLWEGLGYYSRCRNLLSTARYIAGERNGRFPESYQEILALKGIGPYTAAAISSFAYGLPYAVVDGNVLRVLSRIFAIDLPVDSNEGKKFFAALANDILSPENAGDYNQAIMDFGATICKPVPDCKSCFFNAHCLAFQKQIQHTLPRKEKKIRIRKRVFNYFFCQSADEIFIRKRNEKDIWKDLHEFPLIEAENILTLQEAGAAFYKSFGTKAGISESRLFRQKLTHQDIELVIFRAELKKNAAIPGFFTVPLEKTEQYAFPKTLAQYLSVQSE